MPDLVARARKGSSGIRLRLRLRVRVDTWPVGKSFNLSLMPSPFQDLQKQAHEELKAAIRRRESAQRLFNMPRPQISRDQLIVAISQHETAWARFDALTFHAGNAKLNQLVGKPQR